MTLFLGGCVISYTVCHQANLWQAILNVVSTKNNIKADID